MSTLNVVTAGESHGPALVAIVTGPPQASSSTETRSTPTCAASRAGWRSPRQKIETDEVEVLAGLRRQGRTFRAPLALVVRNADHANWSWGMRPRWPDGEPGKRTTVTTPRPGHADLAGAMKFGLDDARRARAGECPADGCSGRRRRGCEGAAAEIGVEASGSVVDLETLAGRVDDARQDRDTIGGVVEARVRGVPPGLGSYATREERLDGRLAAALMGIQAVKGVEIGDGFVLAGLRGSEAHDEIVHDDAGLRRQTNRAGGVEAGVSNGEEVVVREDEAAADLDATAADGRPHDG